MLSRTADYCTPNGANVLAQTILAYWRERGQKPTINITGQFHNASLTAQERVIYILRSDMVGGRPRGRS